MAEFHNIVIIIWCCIHSAHHPLIIPEEEDRQGGNAIDGNKETSLFQLVDDIGSWDEIHDGVDQQRLVSVRFGVCSMRGRDAETSLALETRDRWSDWKARYKEKNEDRLGPRSQRGTGEVLICRDRRIWVASLGYPRYPTWGNAEIVWIGAYTKHLSSWTSCRIHWHRQSMGVLTGALRSHDSNAQIAWGMEGLSLSHLNRLREQNNRATCT